MYHHQLKNLILEFSRLACQRYTINRLFNDLDYRNQCLSDELNQNNYRMMSLIQKIKTVEDLLDHEFRVD